MAKTLTKSYLSGGKFCFHPATQAEAKYIQEQLFDMGFRWREGQTTPQYLDILVKGTLKLEDGYLRYASAREVEGTLLSARQFDPDYIVDDREYLASMFNKLFARMDGIESRLAALEETINPKPLDKPHPAPLKVASEKEGAKKEAVKKEGRGLR